MSQMINCTFIEFHGHMFLKNLIEFNSRFYLKDLVVDKIQTLVFNLQQPYS